MNTVPLFQSLRPRQTVLVLSAHPDDAEIGCGGLLQRLARETAGPCVLRHVVFTGGDDPVRKAEQCDAAKAFGVAQVTIHAYPDTGLPDHWRQIKSDLFAVREEIGADRVGMVICPRLDDRHQDHRTVAENAWRIFRDHLVLEYETPKYEGDLASMNCYVGLSDAAARQKIELLLKSFPSRARHHWWNRETFAGLMRLRGIEANVPWAEAFTVRKMTV